MLDLRARLAGPRACSLAVVLYTYLNPVYTFGFERFLTRGCRRWRRRRAGARLCRPTKPTRNPELRRPARRSEDDPTRRADHAARAHRAHRRRRRRGSCTSFSREGVTGEQQTVSAGLDGQAAAIRAVHFLAGGGRLRHLDAGAGARGVGSRGRGGRRAVPSCVRLANWGGEADARRRRSPRSCVPWSRRSRTRDV